MPRILDTSHADMEAGVRADYQTHVLDIKAFEDLWYRSLYTWRLTSFEGVPVLKNPFDLWIYQDIIYQLKPTLIIETGSAFGGSALFFSHCMERNGGEHFVISIDCEPAATLPEHRWIWFIRAYSDDPAVLAEVSSFARTQPRVMVVLDSDHSPTYVKEELDLYAPFVSRGQMLVVEDMNIGGPRWAVDDWLPHHPEFVRSVLAERYMMTFNRGGWLVRIG